MVQVHALAMDMPRSLLHQLIYDALADGYDHRLVR